MYAYIHDNPKQKGIAKMKKIIFTLLAVVFFGGVAFAGDLSVGSAGGMECWYMYDYAVFNDFENADVQGYLR